MAPFEALYGRKYIIPLYLSKLSESKLVGIDLIRETEDKLEFFVGDQLEFFVGDQVFFKIAPWKKVLWFGRKQKLSPRFIGPYEIVERISLVAYRLALPLELEKIHNYRSDPSHVITSSEIELQSDMLYSKEPIKILAREVKELRNKKVLVVLRKPPGKLKNR
ncbi:DNA/RNA polymerase superfamily protein [Gossypium australe]|uniref:DNA/RNA polymerase superfamily protein n=1 Tax=Gossypium australe TaxID=47621 RepID=A0A5B6X1J0_9ROSI|nr:DNA/RNA polymerase superfamily protein [Gossypium australe]